MRAWLKLTGLFLLSLGLIPGSGMSEESSKSAQYREPGWKPPATSFIRFTSIDGKPMPLSDYAGYAVLVVNTASQCGFTPQYAGLQKLHEQYAYRGLKIIGVPSNDFNQESADSAAIKAFTEKQFHITFPITQKEIVTGESAHPFFKQVRAELGVFAVPKWNFYKYLIAPDGRIVGWWSSKTAPESEEIIKAIEENLPRK